MPLGVWADVARRDLAEPVEDCGVRIEVIGPERARVRAAVQREAFDGSTFTDERWHAMGELHTDARSAPMTEFVLARGRGGLVYPDDVASSPLWHEFGISPGVATEIAAEQQRQAANQDRRDPHYMYWPACANTDRGLVVSLLGNVYLVSTDVRSFLRLEMTYCIFGQKVRDWQSWTLLSPLHVWVEPSGKANWG